MLCNCKRKSTLAVFLVSILFLFSIQFYLDIHLITEEWAFPSFLPPLVPPSLSTYPIMIPPESDMSVIERESKIKEEDEAPWGPCNATTQIKMTFINATQEVYEGMGKDSKHDVAKVVIETYNQYGLAKTQGGDEFYITYFSKGSKSVDAVAYIDDLGNGNYEATLKQPLGAGGNNKPVVAPADVILPGGTLKVILQYTCGAGKLMPPTKVNWTTSGAISNRWEAQVSPDFAPVVIMAKERPKPQQFPEWGAYDAVYAIGDSTMYQFTYQGKVRRNNMDYALADHGGIPGMKDLKGVRLPWYIDMVQGLINARNITHEKGNNTALLLGSGVWDVLDNNEEDQPNFNDHLDATEKMIKSVQNMTDAKIYWKSMTAMHPHVVVNPRGFDRAKYLSNSRAKWLHDEQMELMDKLNIPVLDMFDMTYDHGDMTMRGDGRHFQYSLQTYFINYFYPIEQD